MGCSSKFRWTLATLPIASASASAHASDGGLDATLHLTLTTWPSRTSRSVPPGPRHRRQPRHHRRHRGHDTQREQHLGATPPEVAAHGPDGRPTQPVEPAADGIDERRQARAQRWRTAPGAAARMPQCLSTQNIYKDLPPQRTPRFHANNLIYQSGACYL